MVLAGNGDGQSSCGENPGARPEFEEQQVDFLVAGWRFGWRTNGDNSVREKLSSQAFRPNAPFENVDCQCERRTPSSNLKLSTISAKSSSLRAADPLLVSIHSRFFFLCLFKNLLPLHSFLRTSLSNAQIKSYFVTSY